MGTLTYSSKALSIILAMVLTVSCKKESLLVKRTTPHILLHLIWSIKNLLQQSGGRLEGIPVQNVGARVSIYLEGMEEGHYLVRYFKDRIWQGKGMLTFHKQMIVVRKNVQLNKKSF